MDSIIITPSTQQDLTLLASIAEKMGFEAKIMKAKEKPVVQRIDEVTLLSEPSLAEDWLSEEDDVYDNL